nr:serine/threonine/dual specificity protein kinase, catalytic domain-containing protein [Tanacetum cinerariifolium]
MEAFLDRGIAISQVCHYGGSLKTSNTNANIEPLSQRDNMTMTKLGKHLDVFSEPACPLIIKTQPNTLNLKIWCCRVFSLVEIKLATHDFDDALVIGKVGFGKVYKGKFNVWEGVDVAIKRSNLDSNQGTSEFSAKIEMLSKFCHRHIVSLLGYCEDSSTREMILVYEYMPNESLHHHLHKRKANGRNSSPLTWVQRPNICICSAHALDYLSTSTGVESRVTHHDVKSSNVLLDEKLAAKIFDFRIQVAQKKVKIAFENADSSLRVELIPSKVKYANKVVVNFHKEFSVFSSFK